MSYADKVTVVPYKVASLRGCKDACHVFAFCLLSYETDAAGSLSVLVASTLKAVLEQRKSSSTGDKWD